MKKDKKPAFTLVETMIVVILIGIISLTCVKNIRQNDTHGKEYIAKAYKVIENIDYALGQIRDLDKTNCPLGSFIIKNKIATSGTKYAYELGLLNVSTSSDMFNVLKDYIKFEQTGLNFCDYSGYCSSDNYPAGRISGDIYIGTELYASVSNCPSYYTPEGELIDLTSDSMKEFKTGDFPKCWGRLLVDVNGAQGPNTEGQDIFIYGLDANGIHQ